MILDFRTICSFVLVLRGADMHAFFWLYFIAFWWLNLPTEFILIQYMYMRKKRNEIKKKCSVKTRSVEKSIFKPLINIKYKCEFSRNCITVKRHSLSLFVSFFFISASMWMAFFIWVFFFQFHFLIPFRCDISGSNLSTQSISKSQHPNVILVQMKIKILGFQMNFDFDNRINSGSKLSKPLT